MKAFRSLQIEEGESGGGRSRDQKRGRKGDTGCRGLTRRGQCVEREELWIVGPCLEQQRASERHREETESSCLEGDGAACGGGSTSSGSRGCGRATRAGSSG